MAFTEFTVRSGGSNLYAGSLDGSAEASTTPLVTYTNGAWVSGTGVYTTTGANPVTDGVVAGQFASVYPDGSSAPAVFIARITAVTSATVTVSLTAKTGTAPTTGATGITLVVGGAWSGPSGTSGFPLNFLSGETTDASADPVRINIKNDKTYNITAAISNSVSNGLVMFQGYTTTFGDSGRATIDGGTSGASYALLTLNTQFLSVKNLIFQNNGASGSANLFVFNSAHGAAINCVFSNSRGNGVLTNTGNIVSQCEAFLCNASNTGNTAGFNLTGGCTVAYCNAHDNAGGNTYGYFLSGNGIATLINCIADTNGSTGFQMQNNNDCYLIQCDAYNNGGSGAVMSNSIRGNYIQNCNFVKNGGFGVSIGGNAVYGSILNCGFGSGSQANTSGQISANSYAVLISGSVTYASGATPWVDPANGNFSINLPAAIGTGLGSFVETQTSYSGTVGYPDIGAAQALPGGTSGATFAGG